MSRASDEVNTFLLILYTLKYETLADVRRIKFNLRFVLMTFEEYNWASSRKSVTLLEVVNAFLPTLRARMLLRNLQLHGAVSFDRTCHPEEL
jgi:hypothetical protein